MSTLAKPPVRRPQRKPRAPATAPLLHAQAPLIALFGPCFTKVRFPDDEADRKGFHVLRRSGRAFEMLRERVYGLVSPDQLALLSEHKIPYEVVA